MANEFAVGGPMLQQVAQGLLEMKKMARSIENSADAFLPLANSDVSATLNSVALKAADISKQVSELYRLIAREAAQV